MNGLRPSLYLPLVALLALSCGPEDDGDSARRGRDESVTITRSWPAANVRALRVVEVEGSVSVEAAQGAEISLVATASGSLERKPGQENDGLFETRLDGDTLYVGRRQHRRRGFFDMFVFGRQKRRISYALRVPPAVSLDLNTVNGRITTRGVEGRTDLATVNGLIDVETAGTQEVRATTVNGRVRAKFLSGFQGARFKTVNGGVNAILPHDASFRVDLSQVNGDFEASFPLNIHSNPGSRRVSGDVNGGAHALRITTVNGDVELERLDGQP
jgi:hypothetical protein